MVWLGEPIKWFIRSREASIRRYAENPIDTQYRLLSGLVKKAAPTDWGKTHHYRSIKSPRDFSEQCPVNDYESLKGYFQQIIEGKQQVLWPTPIRWFAKSSGTTSDKSKFIPVSPEALRDCHYKGGFDVMTSYVYHNPGSKIFSGKTLILGGSQTIHPLNDNTRYGDISAVMMSNMPALGHFLRAPEFSIALMSEWESKLQRIADTTLHQRITGIAGVPTWTIVLINKLFEMTGKDNLAEIWPHLELYMHGGVNFDPYKPNFAQLVRHPGMRYLQTYNASEGFFAFQDRNNSDDMLLALDHGIYYEFIPTDQSEEEQPQTVLLEDVVVGKNYAIVISTNAGLWRYKIGDTVQFTSTSPYRIRVSGRTKHFINAFGEEVIVDNADKAISEACLATGATVLDYTVAPVFFGEGNKACHQWLIAFERPPEDLQQFRHLLDSALQSVNSDYEAKRYRDLALILPDVVVARHDLFNDWLKSRGKLGGQNKVPRLSNDRKYMDELLALQVG
jgi:hypothetical protein